jgi:hypothetical protein
MAKKQLSIGEEPGIFEYAQQTVLSEEVLLCASSPYLGRNLAI